MIAGLPSRRFLASARSVGLYGAALLWMGHIGIERLGGRAPGLLAAAELGTGYLAVAFLEVFAIASAATSTTKLARLFFVAVALCPVVAVVDLVVLDGSLARALGGGNGG